MANLIITVIAIALVAVAALMGAYYGGTAFTSKEVLANASTVLNEGTQLAGAWNAYLGDNIDTAPTALVQLTQSNYINNGSYLQTIPYVPAGAGGVPAFPAFVASIAVGSKTHYFAYFDMGRVASGGSAGITDPNAGACIQLQKTAKGSSQTTLASSGQGAIANDGNTTFGCAILTGTISGGLGGGSVPSGDLVTGDYVKEYLLQ